MAHELETHQPLLLDLTVLQQHREKLLMTKSLTGLNALLAIQVRDEILDGKPVTSLTIIFSRVRRVATAAESAIIPQSTIEGSYLVVQEYGCGCERGRESGTSIGIAWIEILYSL